MKKAHIAPVVRKVEFAYNEQVVASGEIFASCTIYYKGLNGAPGTACEIVSMVNNQK